MVEPTPSITTEKPFKPTTVTTTTMITTTVLTDTPIEMATDDNDTIEVEAGGSPPAINPIGDCHDRLFIPHKEDCRKYYLCNFGQLTELTCPNRLVWNIDHCDWLENSKCEISSNVQDNHLEIR